MQRPDTDQISRLVTQARTGDKEAFGALYDLLIDGVYRFIRLRVNRPEDAEDIAETAFINAFKRIRQFEDRGIPFEAWIYTIARNAIIDHYRTHKQPAGLAQAEELTDPSDSPEAKTETSLMYEELLRAMRHLPQSYQDILILVFIEERTTKEISQMLGKPPDQIRVLKQRALDKLRSRMKSSV